MRHPGPIWRSQNGRREIVLCGCLVLFYGALYWKSICVVRDIGVRAELSDDWCDGCDEMEGLIKLEGGDHGH